MQRKALSLAALAVVLAATYWLDRYVIIPMRRQAGSTFDPAPAMWTELAADIAIALAVLGLVWMVFRWSPRSRVVGAIYLVVGFALAAAWPIVILTKGGLSLPLFDQLDPWYVLGERELLYLIAPFLVGIGLLRLLVPLPRSWWTGNARLGVSSEATGHP